MNELLKQKLNKIIKLSLVLFVIVFAGFIIFLNSPNDKGDWRPQISVFKASVSAIVSDILVDCDETEKPSIPLDTEIIDWADSFSSTDCGNEWKNTFSIYAVSKIKNCRATVTETGAKFDGPDCP
ncbi:MAG: hypothetical protein KAI57_00860 [Candidatus Pacebacteria bacterium]|nr:hypothetical protein [Candidatus Paceibacterota bacterium]